MSRIILSGMLDENSGQTSSRLFFAAVPNQALRSSLGEVQDAVVHAAHLHLGRQLAEALLRRIPTENLHVTIHFLGELDTGWLSVLCAMCDDVAPQAPWDRDPEVMLGPALPMPGRRRPRAIACDLPEGPARTVLERTHAALARKLLNAGLPVEKRRYRPHITLFYLRRKALASAGSAELNRFFDDVGMITPASCQNRDAGMSGPDRAEATYRGISGIALLESRLTRAGALYSRACSHG